MKKLHYSIPINASKEKVWQTVLGKDTYPQWTEPFSPGSQVQGDWSVGGKLLFVAPNKDGQLEGMVSTVAESRPPEYLSIKHLGIVSNGVEITEGEEVKKWAPSFENYTLRERDGMTEFLVEMDSPEEYAGMFDDKWPRALDKLKALAEK